MSFDVSPIDDIFSYAYAKIEPRKFGESDIDPRLTEVLNKCTKLEDLVINFCLPSLSEEQFPDLRTLSLIMRNDLDVISIEKYRCRSLEKLSLEVVYSQRGLLDHPVLSEAFPELESYKAFYPPFFNKAHLEGLKLKEVIILSPPMGFDMTAFDDSKNTCEKFSVASEIDDTVYSSLATFTCLSELVIDVPFDSEGFECLFPLLSSLKRFGLKNTYDGGVLEAESLATILLALNPSILESLDLSEVSIRKAHLDIISRFHKLSEINLSIGGDSTIDSFWAEVLGNLSRLESVSIAWVASRDYSVPHGFMAPKKVKTITLTPKELAVAINKLPKLDYFYLGAYIGISSDDFLALVKPEIRDTAYISLGENWDYKIGRFGRRTEEDDEEEEGIQEEGGGGGEGEGGDHLADVASDWKDSTGGFDLFGNEL